MRDDAFEEFFQQVLAEYQEESRDVEARLRNADASLRIAREALAGAASPGVLIQNVSSEEFTQLVREAQQLPEAITEFTRRLTSAVRVATVFGVATTHALQSLRNQVDQFDEWWGPHRGRLDEDPLARTFYVLRSVIAKEGHLGRTFAKMDAYDVDGGTAVYITLRLVGVTVKRLPTAMAEESAITLAGRYIDKIDAIMADAWSVWAPTSVRGGNAGPTRVRYLER